ncbi:MAG: glycosyltransferase family 39 protein, partial [Candidatus Rokubacteria bacterium]|nr:glycosyltransferase family 39 protein [Candidatus Rokubacteria bacterium]
MALLVASVIVFALPLGRRPLDNQDEARYSLLARKAVEEGYWILPRVRGEVYLNKPPLYFWTVAAFALPWGVVTDANAPIASVASAVAGLLAVFAIGRLLWGASAGLAAALILATSPFYFFMAHQVLTDMMLTAWMSWALYFYLAACRAPSPLWPLVGFYLCAAGGLASKGPAALMVLVAVVAASLAADGFRGLKRLKLPLGLALIALTALPWLLPYLFQRERSYSQAVVMTDYLGWYFRSPVASRLAAAAEHLARSLPWGFFILPAALWWVRVSDADRRRLLVWAATLIVLLSLSGEQRARYFLPLWPVFALLVADFFVGAAERARGLVTGAAVVYLILMMGVGAGVLWGTASGPDAVFLPVASWERYVVAGALVAGSALALLSLRVDHSGLAASAWIAMGLGIALAVTAYGYPPRFAKDHDYPGAARRIASLLDPAQPL